MAAMAAFSAGMTYGAPVSTTMYASAPTNYAAPMTMTYGAPVTTAVPMTTAMAAPVQQVRQHIPNLLANGQVVAEQPVSRDELIRRGVLFPDDAREQQLLGQHAAMPGAMQSGYASSMIQQYTSPIAAPTQYAHTQHTQPSQYAHTQQHTQPSQHANTQHHTQPVTSGVHGHGDEQPRTLEITIIHATGLKDLNWSADAMWVQCQSVPDQNKAHRHGKAQHIQTKQIKGTTDPVDKKALDAVWNETHQLGGWFPGETLEFVIYDKGLLTSKSEGKCHVSSDVFFPNGVECEVAIEGLPHASLAVRIVPLQ